MEQNAGSKPGGTGDGRGGRAGPGQRNEPGSRADAFPATSFWSLPGEHVEIPLDRAGEFPLLAECLQIWERMSADGLPSTIDPLQFPRAAIRGLNLFEYDAATDDWRIRVVGSLVTDHVGGELRGTGLAENFTADDREAVRAAFRAAAGRRRPDLLRRFFTDPRGVRWAYIRLFLPLSSDGRTVDRFATVIDPASFGRTGAGATPPAGDRG